MLSMKVTTEDKKDPRYDRILKVLEQAKGAYVTIGFHDDAGQYDDGTDVVLVALANEFGTDKIPERSFFRSTIDQHWAEINEFREEAIENIIDKNWSVEKALSSIGFKIQVLIQNKIQSDVPPPNADSTADQKIREGKAPRTLMDTRLMLRSVTYKVVLK